MPSWTRCGRAQKGRPQSASAKQWPITPAESPPAPLVGAQRIVDMLIGEQLPRIG